MFQALAEKRIGRRDQANAWIWRLAEYTRDVHEEYAVQRWPETKRLLGLLVNSSGGAHARNARRLVHASRKQDRRLSAALLAAAVAHTPEAEEVLRGARTRMARKPSALSRELLRNFPKGRRGRNRRRRKKAAEPGTAAQQAVAAAALTQAAESESGDGSAPAEVDQPRPARRRRSRGGSRATTDAAAGAPPADETAPQPDQDTETAGATEDDAPAAKPTARRRRTAKAPDPGPGDGRDGGGDDDGGGDGDGAKAPAPKAKPKRAATPRRSGTTARRRKPVAGGPDEQVMAEALGAHQDHDGPPLDDRGREQLEDRVAEALSDAKSEEAA
jgi:hypothetical protein